MRRAFFFFLCALLINACGEPSEQATRSLSGKIVFSALKGENWDLYTIDLTSNEVAQLTISPLDERAAAFSPDGSRVAYATSGGSIEIVDVDSKEVVSVAFPTGRYGNPSWGATSKTVIATSYVFLANGEDADLWEAHLEDDTFNPLVTQPGVQDHATTSLDGKRIAYTSGQTVAVHGLGFEVLQHIWVVSPTSGTPSSLKIGDGADSHPVWSPDGARLLYQRATDTLTELWVFDMPEGSERKIVEGIDKSGPVWSPEGDMIAFVDRADGRFRIKVCDLNGKLVSLLEPFGEEIVPIMEIDWK